MNHILTVLLAVIIFLAPTNLFLTLTEETAFVNGLRVDYLIPKLHLVTIVMVLFLAVVLIRQRKLLFYLKKAGHYTRKQPVYVGGALLLSISIVGYSVMQAPISAGWYSSTLLLMLAFGAVLLHSVRQNIKTTVLFGAFLVTIIFQSLVGIYQFVMQTSLGNYWLFGEPNIARFLGLAKTSLNGRELVLPYGTTPHPNVLGGFLAIYVLIVWYMQFKKGRPSLTTYLFTLFASILGIIALILTFSVSAWVTLLVGILVLIGFKIKHITTDSKLKIALLGTVMILAASPIGITVLSQLPEDTLPIDNSSIYRREYLNQSSMQMVADYPVFGVGLNNFTQKIEQYSPEREVVRFIQPVHHTAMLWLAETGLVGLLLVGMLIWRIKRNKISKTLIYSLLILSPILALDHYLLSLAQGNLLVILLTATIALKD